ncbi:MAG: ECF transporter S component [Methanomassiliicoccales archaeon]|nr:ECF transporter S component [Methanomassiliicoccales archaeon]
MDANETLVMIFYLLVEMALVITVALGLSRTRWFKDAVKDRLTPANCAVLIATFGALAILGTYLAVDYETSKINIRDFPVVIAGLIGGPVLGLGAGLIGGVQRYFAGGATAIPCAISTILSGVVAGLVHRHYGKFPKMHVAIITSFVLAVIHMVLVTLISSPSSVGGDITSVIALPMIAFAVIGMTAFSLMYFRFMEPQ